MKLLGSLYLTRFFFVLLVTDILLYGISFLMPELFMVASIFLISLIGAVFIDVFLSFLNENPIQFTRTVSERLNLGDVNTVKLKLENTSYLPLTYTLYEGYPVQLQERSKKYSGLLLPYSIGEISYSFTPKKRGELLFSNPFVVIRSVLTLVNRKLEIESQHKTEVYPSVAQLKKYELLVFQQQKTSSGIKKIRRLGNNSEFEQIKNYVQGDELKTINWKATSRKGELMVNQYQEEKAQHVFMIIDKSRNMQMEFDDLTMLDYAINSALVFSNIALRKGDRTGLITFSDKIGSQLPADGSSQQMRRIIETLYSQKTHFKEGNFELLYQTISRNVRTRSLLLLYTNFETEFAMRRALPLLRKINQKHVLVVVFFQNNELVDMAYQKVNTIRDVYQSAIAERMITIKSKIAQELKRHGIQSILTKPEDLSINTINKYLELKAKGAI